MILEFILWSMAILFVIFIGTAVIEGIRQAGKDDEEE